MQLIASVLWERYIHQNRWPQADFGQKECQNGKPGSTGGGVIQSRIEDDRPFIGVH